MKGMMRILIIFWVVVIVSVVGALVALYIHAQEEGLTQQKCGYVEYVNIRLFCPENGMVIDCENNDTTGIPQDICAKELDDNNIDIEVDCAGWQLVFDQVAHPCVYGG